MSQLLARQTIADREHELVPEQLTLHELPLQSTPPWQAASPQLMSQDEALPQSTAPSLQAFLPQSTRQGMPAGQWGTQLGSVQSMTHTPAEQLPLAALQAASTHGGGPLPPLPPVPAVAPALPPLAVPAWPLAPALPAPLPPLPPPS